ncbi:MAG: hypothetical protein A3J76_01530 [Candidatus Moranbacteria bacterium RBG_13_45_13]|nr:MAG: hypothetical protein A3J76_01530 [Candidatus Moranbacteria bacterium RBG_13_45_13]
MPNIVLAMNTVFVRGLKCPGTTLAQKEIAEEFLINCTQAIKLRAIGKPFSKVCEPSYPGYDGIAANVLLENCGYITVATIVPRREAWINFAPILSEDQGPIVIMYLISQIFHCFKTQTTQAELSSVNLEQLAKRRVRLLEMRQSYPGSH